MSSTEPNIPLLRKAVEWVEQQDALPFREREWYQAEWIASYDFRWNHQTSQMEEVSCGTAYCVAGYIGQLSEPQYKESSYADIGDEDLTHVSEYAQRELGLGDGQAHRLFHARNTAADIREIAEEIAGERL